VNEEHELVRRLRDEILRSFNEVLVEENGPEKSVENISSLRKAELQVVGDYNRFDPKARVELLGWVRAIEAPLRAKTVVRENFLICSGSGSGKSFFVEQVGSDLGPRVKFLRLNLAKQSEEEVSRALARLDRLREPTLVLVDEIDARTGEAWPYERIFSYLDGNLLPTRQRVFVLAGSCQGGIRAMVDLIISRPKGPDLLDRIPDDRRFEIPALCREDRAAIFATNVGKAAATRRMRISQIEKLAVYYVVVSENSSRQLRDLAYSAVSRLKAADDRVCFDDLFRRGEQSSHTFCSAHQLAVERLANRWVEI